MGAWRAALLLPVLLPAVLPITPVARAAEPFVRLELRIPMQEAGPAGLEALLVYPNNGRAHPLALLSHGSPRSAEARPHMTTLQFLPEAMEFARRGWAAAIVLRRGYGRSGGGWAEEWGGCGHADFARAGAAQLADLRAAIRTLSTLPQVDGTRILAVGHSAGGMATLALAADAPPGLVAAISFAGGRASVASGRQCDKQALLAAFRKLGAGSRAPMLWVYSENDQYFPLPLARDFRSAFEAGRGEAGGGKVEFVEAPPFGTDGHLLFSQEGIPIWAPLVDRFLAEHQLTLRSEPLPLPSLPTIPPPAGLKNKGRQGFQAYLAAPPHKAFGLSAAGQWAWRSGRRTTDEARAEVLQKCARSDCRIVMIDDDPAAP